MAKQLKAKAREKEGKASEAREKENGEKPEDKHEPLDFVEYFTPDARKLAYFALLLCAAIIPLFVFAMLVNVRVVYVVNALFDPRSAIAVAATYVFACFSIKRSIPLWQSFLVVFVPELIVVALIATRYGPVG